MRKIYEKETNFGKIYFDYFEDFERMLRENGTAANILLLLMGRSDKKNNIRITIKTICELTNKSNKTVIKAIKYLIDNDWLERKIDSNNISMYVINPMIMWKQDSKNTWQAGYTYTQSKRHLEKSKRHLNYVREDS